MVTGKRADTGTHGHSTVRAEVEAQYFNTVHGSEEISEAKQSATQVKNNSERSSSQAKLESRAKF